MGPELAAQVSSRNGRYQSRSRRIHTAEGVDKSYVIIDRRGASSQVVKAVNRSERRRVVLQRLDPSEDIAQFIGGAFEIVLRLHIHPESWGGPEIPGQPQGRVGSDWRLLAGKTFDARARNATRPRDVVGREFH